MTAASRDKVHSEMSAVYKVLADMQKTKPRRVRVPGVVLLILAGLCITAVWMVSIQTGPQVGLKTDDRNHPRLRMPVAKYGHGHCHGPGPALVVSLSPEGQWVELENGVVSESRLREIMIERRDEFQAKGWHSRVVVRIGANQSAHYLKRIHEISVECGMDELGLGTWSRDPRES